MAASNLCKEICEEYYDACHQDDELLSAYKRKNCFPPTREDAESNSIQQCTYIPIAEATFDSDKDKIITIEPRDHAFPIAVFPLQSGQQGIPDLGSIPILGRVVYGLNNLVP
jgi:hypothetical protein